MPKPKNKKYKSLDDDSCDIVKIATEENDTENAINPDDDSDILTEKSEEDDSVQVEKVDEDSVTISEIVPNLPPKRMWSDGVKLKFKTGDLVIKKGDKNLKNVLKVLGPGIKLDTYSVMNSCSTAIWYISITEVKRAPVESKWISYVEFLKKNDPYEQFKLRAQREKLKPSKKKN